MGIRICMLMSLPSMNFRATSHLRPGSLIEYQYYTDALGVKEGRAFGIIISIDWRPSHARSRCLVLSREAGANSVDIAKICRIITY